MKLFLYKEFMSELPSAPQGGETPALENGACGDAVADPAGSASGIDTSNPLAPPQSTLAHVPPSAPTPITLESVSCPSCEAVLRNIRVEAGATLRCLNCGKRFAPILPGSTESQPILAGGVAGTTAEPVREPGSVGYWLLRIPAILLFAGASVVTAMIVFFNLRTFNARFDAVVLCSYVPLIPWAGAFLFLITRSLARLDAGGIRCTWKSGALKSAIPPVPGSSLPYVAPIAIAGGILPVICVRADPDAIETAIIGTLFGGVLFYIGFALEDLRQFIWRQEYLARACCKDYGIDDSPIRYGNGVSWSGVSLTVAVASFGAGVIMMSLRQMQWRPAWRQALLPLYIGVGLIAISYSLNKLSRDWDRAIRWWQLARWAGKFKAVGVDVVEKLKSNLSPWEPNWTPPPVDHDLSSAMRPATWVPRLWVAWGVVWMASLLIRDAPSNSIEFFGVMFFCLFGAGLAFWLSFFLPQLARWSGAQKSIWMLRGAFSKTGGSAKHWMFWSALIFAGIEAMLFGILMINQWSNWSRWRFEEIALFPLLMVMIHYPIIWLAMTLREMMELESSCGTEGAHAQ